MNCWHKIGPHLGCMILWKPCRIFNTVQLNYASGQGPPLVSNMLKYCHLWLGDWGGSVEEVRLGRFDWGGSIEEVQLRWFNWGGSIEEVRLRRFNWGGAEVINRGAFRKFVSLSPTFKACRSIHLSIWEKEGENMWLKASLNAKSVNLPQPAKMSLTLILHFGIFSIKSSVQNALQSLAEKVIWNFTEE